MSETNCAPRDDAKGEEASPPGGASRVDERAGLAARDLITVAIFGAIYVVITYLLGMIGVFGPLAWMISVLVTVLVNGITFMLFYARVRRAGMVLLLSVILALAFLLHGGALVGALAAPVVGLGAELVARSGRYASRASGIGACTVFGLTAFVPFLPMLVDRESYFRSAAWQSMGADYVRAAEQVFTVPMMLALAVACLVAGLLGGLLGAAVLRKHFVRAGLA
ncbi:MptD family putative ECF transporter S component [Arsenicicoccus dermatophilus]|uniref:MptD family putative ECF transporter S component n=1 Tax=Arsenicicoccus dermatophilus TaxID=1076331 RepID=UPI001F4CF4A6|nr:MptD family putative ECF transporter S component [Arsenicicoccus dermatophilus]MCH8614039.1 MptD family putative ECF transporter S component [Arsenicicoccus dermatophilus]